MRRIELIILAVSCLFPLGLEAGGLQFPPSDFPKVSHLLCDPAQAQISQELGKTCQYTDFTIRGEDLQGNGQIVWFFYGPSVECGVHGNCPLALLTKKENRWLALSSVPCPGQDCLNFGNALFSQTLKTSHHGLRDLLISTDSGSFYWVKDIYQWTGSHYVRKKDGATYFFYDGDADRLVQVSQSRYESCVREGKNCLRVNESK